MEFLKSNNSGELKNGSVDSETLTAAERLGLCLYFIELEFHFTGDGIWSDFPHNQTDFVPQPLPDFPQTQFKQYKFVDKPRVSSVGSL